MSDSDLLADGAGKESRSVCKDAGARDDAIAGGTSSNASGSELDVATHKSWNAFATPAIGKLVRKAARLARSGGSAFPGKVVESIDPGFLARTLDQLPLGVVLVSGTNGKTTTARMVATMLEGLGLKVFTNPSGSNFTRGVVSALLDKVSLSGKLDADIAVLELGEAYAVHFVRQAKPRYCLLPNVISDQLDRFGEIDNAARLLNHVAEATTVTVVLNREDPRIAALAEVAANAADVRYFGLDTSLQSYFPSDDDMTTTVSAAGLSSDTRSNAEGSKIILRARIARALVEMVVTVARTALQPT